MYKHLLLISLFVLGMSGIVPAQVISENDWKTIIKPLSEENWKEGERITAQFLGKFKNGSDTLLSAGIVRYMYIRCVAARLAKKEYNEVTALGKVKRFVGKQVVTPNLKFKQTGVLNFVTLNDKRDGLALCATNEPGTEIQTIESYHIDDTDIIQHISELEGKEIRLVGTIKSIKKGGVTMPHLQIMLTLSDILLGE